MSMRVCRLMRTCSHEQATTLLGKGGRGKRFHTLEQDHQTNSASKPGADVELALQPEAGAGHVQDLQVGCRERVVSGCLHSPYNGRQARCESRACSGTAELDLSKLLWYKARPPSALIRQVQLAVPLTKSTQPDRHIAHK